MIIVVDTNVFHSDVGARRPLFGAVLDGAANGDFEVVTPEIVVQELVRQYPERLREARQQASTAFETFKRLNLASKNPFALDVDKLIATYETDLRDRLGSNGCRIAKHPQAIQSVLGWAIRRRKPFKIDGSGLPDAFIWATVLELAATTEPILFVTANIKDFADPALPNELAADLRSDLASISKADVRLITSVERLVDEVVKPLAAADTRASRLMTVPTLHERLRKAIVEGTLFRAATVQGFDVGVDLVSGPRIASIHPYELALTSSRPAGDGRLILSLEALADVVLELAIEKSDYDDAEDYLDASVEIIDPDFDDRYLAAEARIGAHIAWNVVTDGGARRIEVEVTSAVRASASELLEARLQEGGEAELERLLSEHPSGQLHSYVPEGLESRADEATLDSLTIDTWDIVDVDEPEDVSIGCVIKVDGTAQVTWTIAAPTGRDSAAYNDADGGPLQGVDTTSCTVTIEGALAPDGTWSDFAVTNVSIPGDVEQT